MMTSLICHSLFFLSPFYLMRVDGEPSVDGFCLLMSVGVACEM